METLINIVFNHEKAAIVPDFTFMQTAYCAYYFLRILSRLLLLVTHLTYCLSVTLQCEIMQDQNESVMCIYFILILFVHFSLTSWQQKQLQAPWKHHWGQMVNPRFCM